jgi:hypothetical protein
MRILILIAFLIVVPVISNGQFTGKNEQKANTNKTIFRVASVTGAALIATGGLLFLSEMGKPAGEYNESRSKTGETLVYVGTGIALVSFTFMIANRKNDYVDGSISLETNDVPSINRGWKTTRHFPALSLKIALP